MQVRRLFREEGASVRGRVRRIPPRQLEPGHDSHSRRERDVPAGGAVVRGNQARFGLADLRDDGHEHDEHDDEDEDDVQTNQDQHLESGHGNVDDDANDDEDVSSGSGLGSEEYEIHYQHGSESESESESENDTDDDEFLYGDSGNNDDDDENFRTQLFGEIPRVRLSFEGTWEVLGGW